MSHRPGTTFCSAGVLLLLATIFAAPTARANGRYPLATQFVALPGDSSYLALRSTFGVLQTFDSGQSWSWVCEQAAGYIDIRDPTLAIAGDGTLLVGAEKLFYTTDRGCAWFGADYGATIVTDLVVDRLDSKRVV